MGVLGDDTVSFIGESLRAAYPVREPMNEGEILTRAREAYIAVKKPWRWLARRIRAGYCDRRLRGIILALHDIDRPVALIVSERDQATAALILRTAPGLRGMDKEMQTAVAGAILTAVRMGRRG